MDGKMFKYTLVSIVFFVGLSMGVSYQQKEQQNSLQAELRRFESEIQTPDNDFEPKNPYDNNSDSSDSLIKHNVFTVLAKDGEYVIKVIFDAIFNKSDDFIRFLLGM